MTHDWSMGSQSEAPTECPHTSGQEFLHQRVGPIGAIIELHQPTKNVERCGSGIAQLQFVLHFQIKVPVAVMMMMIIIIINNITIIVIVIIGDYWWFHHKSQWKNPDISWLKNLKILPSHPIHHPMNFGAPVEL